MKKYEFEWTGAESRKIITHHIVTDSLNDAFAQAVEKYKCPAHPEMYVVWIWGFSKKRFDNPHFDPNYVEPKESDIGSAKHARSDGSVGWRENLVESGLSGRDILLAQLHELRTVKRCGVCTMHIVIPIVFGVIR